MYLVPVPGCMSFCIWHSGVTNHRKGEVSYILLRLPYSIKTRQPSRNISSNRSLFETDNRSDHTTSLLYAIRWRRAITSRTMTIENLQLRAIHFRLKSIATPSWKKFNLSCGKCQNHPSHCFSILQQFTEMRIKAMLFCPATISSFEEVNASEIPAAEGKARVLHTLKQSLHSAFIFCI